MTSYFALVTFGGIILAMNSVPIVAKLPVPTGNPWLPTPDDPATVPIPVPVIIVRVEGPYTAQDRKLWTFLLHAVWDELDDKVIHEIPIKEINGVFRQLSGRHHTDWLWESAERLAATRIRWIRTDGDRRYKGVDNLLGAETDEDAKETGMLRFNFPPLLIPILKDPKRFARLRTHVMIELSSKYAVTLYELLESIANKDSPVLEASVEELRQWLKVPTGKMMRWQDFRRKVLEKAVKQINGKAEEVGFRVMMKPLKESRAVTRVWFMVVKTKERIALEDTLRDREPQHNLSGVLLKTETYEKAKQYARGWDVYALEDEWRAWAQIKRAWPPRNPDGAFINFCKQRGPYPWR